MTLGIPNIRECGPELARRPTLKTWMPVRRANGGGRLRAQGRMSDWYPGTNTKIAMGTMGKII
jgi:hypothetical protein